MASINYPLYTDFVYFWEVSNSMPSINSKVLTILTFVLAFAVAVYAADSRTKLKPGWNLFSPQQDVDMGRQSAMEAEKQLRILNDRQATAYIDSLGKQL